jgi:hypothetical protein
MQPQRIEVTHATHLVVLVGVVQSVVEGRDQANRVAFRVVDAGEMVGMELVGGICCVRPALTTRPIERSHVAPTLPDTEFIQNIATELFGRSRLG